MITDINSEDLEKADTQETLPAGRLEATDKLSLDSDAGSEYTRRAWGADQRSVGVPPASVCAGAARGIDGNHMRPTAHRKNKASA